MRVVKSLRHLISHTVEPTIESNAFINHDLFFRQLLPKPTTPLSGRYDRNGFVTYFDKNKQSRTKPLLTDASLSVSSIGLGTYRGSLDASDDLLMFNGVLDSLNNGINVIDTCRNFRGGRSEFVIGKVLQYLTQQKLNLRNEFFVSSKAGYVRDDFPMELDRAHIINDHCVHPSFLKQQLNRSLQLLGLETIDVYFLNNFAESQLSTIKTQTFELQLCKAFQFLQEMRISNKIQHYGLSSWQSFRVAKSHEHHVSLARVVELAEKVGGKRNGFKFLQIPINVLMPEAFADRFQEGVSLIEAAEALNLNVMSNSPLLGGSLINVNLPAKLLKCDYDGPKHLMLIKSIPSKALVCTLIGQKQNRHIRTNLQAVFTDSLLEEEWLSVFSPNTTFKEIQSDEADYR